MEILNVDFECAAANLLYICDECHIKKITGRFIEAQHVQFERYKREYEHIKCEG
jgi:hypothetical protein